MLNSIKAFMSTYNFSLNKISFIGIFDILDILIIAFLIYQIIIWVQETRTWALFKGIAVVFIMAALSLVFNFVTISWIVRNAFGVGFIAILIVFQTELRKALEELGKRKNYIPFMLSDSERPNSLQTSVLEEILYAVEKMAKEKTGALILIQCDVGLGDLEKTGLAIDAVVSSQLILNIFEHNTPLHDGAMIIRNNRIAAATCILPLTQDEIGRELGTRHRAAVGASEVSDAIILVVSEETGAVSVAHNGKLHRKLKKEQIREMFFNTTATEKRKLTIWRSKHNDKEVNK